MIWHPDKCEQFNKKNVEAVLGAQGDAKTAVKAYLGGELGCSICREHQYAGQCGESRDSIEEFVWRLFY